jgi:hypothetical protein
MKRLIFAGALALIAGAAQAQGSNQNSRPVQGPYTTLGPAGAGGYMEPSQTHPDQREHQHRRHAKRDAFKKGAGLPRPFDRQQYRVGNIVTPVAGLL